jgi:hypothetical protein
LKNIGAYPDKRRWRELREACLERAGKRCEFVYPNGKRCARHDEEERISKSSGKRYIVYLHAAHLHNSGPEDQEPELICLCPSHHLKRDRQLEALERISQRRRGYRITTTDTLLEEARSAGVEITEHSDGYHWSVEHLGLGGRSTTAAGAIGCALYQLRLAAARLKAKLEREVVHA